MLFAFFEAAFFLKIISTLILFNDLFSYVIANGITLPTTLLCHCFEVL